ncbi:MAG: Unknown protein [uncultured Thiotrichaceae bacterium]|uniref:Type 4 fimbrial biogenesis protein PilX N-terminal domain-containing protein n=1 Tax=uncultured Thiotrichaceae bacterium TaxID=298394 RepID=A0A6S6SM62_9GAMM|nr:MAG: Unknown protein [uncultured Thiotrichaceae bacterium]
MNNSKYKISALRQKTQAGSVLLWGLVILLTLTVIGVSAARMGVTDIRIAGNQIFGTMTYQSSESVLERVSTLFHINETDGATDMVQSWDFADEMNDGGSTNSTGTISMAGSIQCAPQEGFAMSAEMVSDAGGISCLLYTMDSQASLAGTGARSNHSQGVMKYVPGNGSIIP